MILRPASFAMLAAGVATLVCSIPGLAVAGPVTAQRTAEGIHLDGAVDDAAWLQAPAMSDFVESFPREGGQPGFKTEVRVAYDDTFLYIAVVCFDPEPSGVVRQLGRRDSTPASDRVEVAIDSSADGKTAYQFIVNAAGGQRDLLLFGDVNATDTWDAVWDAAVASRPDGWSAELAIPLRVFRFSSAEEQSWGFHVRRYIPRNHEIFDSSLIPRAANPQNPGAVVVSRFAPLQGLRGLRPSRGLEILPYAGLRGVLRPLYSDPSRPEPRLLDPTIDLGVDVKLALTSHLMLTAAVNPDFGQVESDQVIQNLSTFEQFFPEKRPFFLEGLDLFQPVGFEYGSPQQLFYSRRIGLDAPILAAAKLSGTVRPGLELGLLETVVTGAGNASLSPLGYTGADPETIAALEENPDRRWRFRLRQPLHFGPEDALPAAHPVATNYFAAVARQALGPSATVGATFTAATPLEPRCRPEEFSTAEEYARTPCASRGSNVLGLDVNVRDASGVWGGFAQIEASQQVGGEPQRRLRDGTLMRPGELGFGGHLRAGKLGGDPWRWDLQYVFEDPRLDVNDMGFQQLSNYQWLDLWVHYVRPTGFGPFHSFNIDYLLDLNWTADGKWLPRGINSNLNVTLQLPSYDTVGLRSGLELPQYDTREIFRAGVPFERMGNAFLGLVYNTDSNRRLFVNGGIFAIQMLPYAQFEGPLAWGIDLNATWRPMDRLETRLDTSYAHKPQGPRWVDTVDGGQAVFGLQDPEFFSITLRQQLVLSPRLTAQIYAQLFSGAFRFAPQFFAASLEGRSHLPMGELAPFDYAGDPSGHDSSLNLNAVLRWEYRLGSTLFLVYTRSQRELPPSAGAPPARSVLPSRLFSGPVTESLMLKLSYWFDV